MINNIIYFIVAVFVSGFIIIFSNGIIETIKENTEENSAKRKVYNWIFIIIVAFLLMCGYSLYESHIDKVRDAGYDNGFQDGRDDCYREMSTELDEAEDNYKELSKNIYKLAEENVFYKENVCLVTSSGECYHNYSCYHINWNNDVYIFTTFEAISNGYRPCIDCH